MDAPAPIDRVAQVLGWAMLALLAYLVFLVVRPFLMPLGWAAVFAILSYRLHAQLARRIGRTWAALLTTIGIAVVLVVPAMLALSAFVTEAMEAAAAVQRAVADGRLDWLERAWREFGPQGAAQRPELDALIGESVRRGSTFLLAQSGLLLRDMALLPINLGIALFATFFLLRDAEPIMRAVRRLLPMHEATREMLVTRTGELVTVGITSALVVAAIQGSLGGLVFWLVGLPAPIFWGVLMGAFCLLPFGAWVIWLPAAAMLIGSGEVTRGLIVAVLGVAVVSAADNVLRPMLMSGRGHVHGLVILVGLLGGMAVFGALGLVLGPILLATALALLSAYVEAPPHDNLAGVR